jgi:hypothetical protein
MARAIVRYSISGEQSNITGNAARGALADFDKPGTALYEAEGSPADLIAALRDLLDVLEDPPGGGEVDHLWIYFDQTGDSN